MRSPKKVVGTRANESLLPLPHGSASRARVILSRMTLRELWAAPQPWLHRVRHSVIAPPRVQRCAVPACLLERAKLSCGVIGANLEEAALRAERVHASIVP